MLNKRDAARCEESSCLRLLLDKRDAWLGPWIPGRCLDLHYFLVPFFYNFYKLGFLLIVLLQSSCHVSIIHIES